MKIIFTAILKDISRYITIDMFSKIPVVLGEELQRIELTDAKGREKKCTQNFIRKYITTLQFGYLEIGSRIT
jgi:hypothetical protein